MKSRKKSIEIINGMSASEVEVGYAHLRRAADQPGAGDEFKAALEARWQASVGV
jgi:hypothetical protein